MEQWIRREPIYSGRVISLEAGEVALDNGETAPREIVLHCGGVGVAPLVDGQVILVKQYRIAVERDVIELPAGKLEPGDTPETRAAQELEEETGYRPGRLVQVASCYCSPGFTNELDHIYLAFDCVKTKQNLEYDERIELVHIPLDEIESRLQRREFIDAKTIIGLRELLAYLARVDGE